MSIGGIFMITSLAMAIPATFAMIITDKLASEGIVSQRLNWIVTGIGNAILLMATAWLGFIAILIWS